MRASAWVRVSVSGLATRSSIVAKSMSFKSIYFFAEAHGEKLFLGEKTEG